MKTKGKATTEQEIDRLATIQARSRTAWEAPLKVTRAKATSVSFSAKLAARAAFFARLHRELSLEKWLSRIVQERLDLEEAAFAGFKKELSSKSGR